MRADLSLNFLLGFTAFFAWLVLILTVGFKSDGISIHDKKRFNRSRLIMQSVWFVPFLLAYLYLLHTQDTGLNEFLMLVFLPAAFLFGCEFLSFRPRLNFFIIAMDRLFSTLKVDASDPRYSFNATTDKLVLARDKPVYVRGLFVDVHLDRVCKNKFGEYFWVQASANQSSQPTIEHINAPHVARNLLRANRDVYLQEFNEEPYFKSK